jgi:alcohol dehydrogenase class IV
MTIASFSFPTAIRFGPGASTEVRAHLQAQGFSRPLVVTDAGLAKLPLMSAFVGSLSPLAVEVCADVAGNPVEKHVVDGVSAYRRHRADCIVGIGGGAALDVAKAIALMVEHPGAVLDYEDGKPGARPIERPIPYWVAVPTTSGTGSEVGRSTVISDAQHVKRIGLPAKITAATGMDAVTHCVEAYLAKDLHPICDGIALEGLRIAGRALPRCVSTPQDIEARSEMMMASMMGAIAFQKGLGVAHSCAHALGQVADLHHGLACGMMIDTAIRMNAAARPDRFSEMARIVGAKEHTPEGFLRWLADMKAQIGIPSKLSQAGVKPEHLPRLPAAALADSCHQNNPVPVSLSDFERIFREAA